MKYKNCLVCQVSFAKSLTSSSKEWARRKFCSVKCKALYQVGKPGAGLGIPKSMSENEHHKWKGGGVGYVSLHQWVAKWKGRPSQCEQCGFISDNSRQFHWANISGQYLRDLNDYKRLCVPCHKRFDQQKGYGSKALYIARTT